MRPAGLWQKVDLVPETGSTNSDAAQAARDGAAEGLVIVAESQRAGRGRLACGDRRRRVHARIFAWRPDAPTAAIP